ENIEQKSILIVDDMPANLHLLGQILENEQYDVRLSPNGTLALNSAKTEPPDLILLDIKMPGLTGYDVCEQLKADDRTRDIPVIFISALQETMEKIKAFKIGGVDYITKPFQEEEVLARIRIHLQLQSLQICLNKKNSELADMNKQLNEEIATRKRLEAEHLKIKTLESLAFFAGGIAHDFNNLLFIIMGNTELIKDDTKGNSGVLSHINGIEKAVFRANDLTRQFISISRSGGPENKKKDSLQGLISNSIYFSESVPSIKYNNKVPDNLWLVEFDAGKMLQVMKNLLDNANESMPHGGTICINAENVILNQETQKHNIPLPNGRYIRICIRDQGIGISNENLSRIFAPYFSSKDRCARKGMGLGLTVAFSIVRKHHGHISVESKQGTGSEFCIYLKAVL
ncbi:response regulator, partial [Desulfobacterales bacterium HSG17]|nr:response regulator [Desulfobacterales bacterium HSG17]